MIQSRKCWLIGAGLFTCILTLSPVVRKAVEGGFAAELFLPAVRPLAASDPDPMVRERSEPTIRRLEGPADPELRKLLEQLRKRHRKKQRESHEEQPP